MQVAAGVWSHLCGRLPAVMDVFQIRDGDLLYVMEDRNGRVRENAELPVWKKEGGGCIWVGRSGTCWFSWVNGVLDRMSVR
jgi:hypothetical protein